MGAGMALKLFIEWEGRLSDDHITEEAPASPAHRQPFLG